MFKIWIFVHIMYNNTFELLTLLYHLLYVHCTVSVKVHIPKINPNFRDITWHNRDGRAFLVSRSRVPGILGRRVRRARESKFYTGTREHGTRKNRNTKFAFLWRDDTVMKCTERRGGSGDCGRDMSLTSNRLPASIPYLYTVHTWHGGVVVRWQIDPAHLICPYTPTPYTYARWHRSIGTRNRNIGA